MISPKEAIGQAEQRYLRAIYELAGAQAKSGVSYSEVQEYLSFTDDEASHCCDFWTRRGVVEWSDLGHIALTHLGLAGAERIGGSTIPGQAETIRDGRGLGQDHEDSPRGERLGSISVVIPVRNEAKTIDQLVRLVRRSPGVREVLVVDDGSIDGTPEIASSAGALVMMSSFLGKGASMVDGIEAATGGIVLFLDGDLVEIEAGFVEKLIDPIITGQADLVKAKFTRDAGRVTVLTARPLLGAFFPELAAFDQPLGGIVAVRHSLLGRVRLEHDYGVDVGLLIDAVVGGAKAVEVDIGRIDHDSKPLEALGEMAEQITRVILDRAWRYERLSINQVREMEETARRSRAEVFPAADYCGGKQKYALFDMDGVLLDGRYVVELADRVEAQSELSRFLDNEILPDGDRTQVIASLFVGVPKDVFEETARSVPLVEGAIETVVTLRRSGYRVGIVTDSFHVAAEIVRRRVFADFCVANIMHFKKGVATGEVTLSPAMIDPDGCRLHHYCKLNVVRYLHKTAGLRPEDTLAVGDGRNDICMLREAGLSIAFRPKSRLVEEAAQYTLHRSLLEVVDLSRNWSSAREDRTRVGELSRCGRKLASPPEALQSPPIPPPATSIPPVSG